MKISSLAQSYRLVQRLREIIQMIKPAACGLIVRYTAKLEDKKFEIINPVPCYEESKDLDDPTKKKRKLIVSVRLGSGYATRWYANKTSQKAIMRERGFKLADWVGFKGEFYTGDSLVNGTLKKVIYCKAI